MAAAKTLVEFANWPSRIGSFHSNRLFQRLLIACSQKKRQAIARDMRWNGT